MFSVTNGLVSVLVCKLEVFDDTFTLFSFVVHVRNKFPFWVNTILMYSLLTQGTHEDGLTEVEYGRNHNLVFKQKPLQELQTIAQVTQTPSRHSSCLCVHALRVPNSHFWSGLNPAAQGGNLSTQHTG